MKKSFWIKATLLMMFTATTALCGRVFVVATNGADGNAGTVAQPWQTLAKANATLIAGDTLYIRTGTYRDPIRPANSGSAGTPLVYANYPSEVCSLYVNANAMNLTDRSYVIVQGIAIEMAQSVNDHVVTISGGGNNAILNCRIYGGSTHNNPTWGDWPSFIMSNTSYNRIIGNLLDRQDHDITSDANRGDGLGAYGTSRYNIIEANTVVNVSHFGIAVPYGVVGESYNIVRNNRAYNCHVGLGNTDQTSRCLYEGNFAWSPGEVNTYRGGIACEFSPEKCIIRYNAFYDDSISVGSLQNNGGSNNVFVTNNAVSTPIDNRIYHNTFMGASGTNAERCSIYLQNDNPGVWDFGRNSFVNNIFAYPNQRAGSYPIWWQDRGKTLATVTDRFRGNLIWKNAPGDIVANWGVSGGVDNKFTLAQLKALIPEAWDNTNFESTPLWMDSTSTQGNRNFTLSPASPCIDRGVPLTQTVQSSGNTTAIHVSDASYFHYAWSGNEYDHGDSIYIDGVRAELQNIDYQNNILYTTNNVTVGNDAGVYLLASYYTIGGYQSRLKGTAPDVGASESGVTASVVTQAPSAPTLLSPADADTGIAVTGQLRWTASSGAVSHQAQVSANSTFLTTVIDRSGITGTFFPLSALAFNTTYYWRVRSSNTAGTSPWSAVRHFNTQPVVVAPVLQPPAAPALLTPADGDTGVSVTGQIQWAASQGATSSQVQVSLSSAFLTTVIDQNGAAATSYPLFTLGYNTQYYWRVRALNAAGASAWSVIRHFTTSTDASIPQKNSVNVVANGGFENGTLDWNFFTTGSGSFSVVTPGVEGSMAGHVTISQPGDNTQLFQTGLILEPATMYHLTFSATSGQAHNFTVGLLKNVAPFTKYGLPARPFHPRGSFTTFSTYFQTSNFTETVSDARLFFSFAGFAASGDDYRIDNVTIAKSPAPARPPAPTIVSPAQAAFDQSLSTTVSWTSAVDADSYRFQLSADSLFATTVMDSVVSDTAVVVGQLAPGTQYFQRVCGTNISGDGTYSVVSNFSTESRTKDAGNGAPLPTDYVLAQNYPNPFNPTTMMQYSLPANTHVILKVYNALGAEVATLADKDQSAGTYEIRFDASRLASGVYLYSLQTPDVRLTKRMVLVR